MPGTHFSPTASREMIRQIMNQSPPKPPPPGSPAAQTAQARAATGQSQAAGASSTRPATTTPQPRPTASSTATANPMLQPTASPVQPPVNNRAGWTVGQPIDAPTRAGNPPVWNTARQRFWKNEAFYNPTHPQAERMQSGRAPQRFNETTGQPESMHLHHRDGRNIPNPHAQSNLEALWPAEHWKAHGWQYAQ